MTIEAELSTAGRSAHPGQPAERPSPGRPPPGPAGPRCSPPRTSGWSAPGPAERRRFLDETLAVVDPKAARAAEEVDKVLRQRAALLRTSGRRLTPEVADTLDVWDTRLDAAGTALVEAREQLVTAAGADHRGALRQAGRDQHGGRHGVRAVVDRAGCWTPWPSARTKDVERGVSSVGPHRDELDLTVDGLPGRTHASQGEQRSLALALQLAAHQLATERLGSAPVLLLDDVFSELDPFRSRALLAGLPPGQALLTTALPAPHRGGPRPGSTLVEAGGHARPGTVTPTRDPEEHQWHHDRPAATPARGPLDASLDAVSRKLGHAGLTRARAACSPTGRRSWARPWPSTSSRSGSTRSPSW